MTPDARRLIWMLLLPIAPAVATAQRGRVEVLRPQPAPGRAQLAGVAPAPAPVRARKPLYTAVREGYGYWSYGQGGPIIYAVPVALSSDGRVFADFGNGYEQVARSCAAADGADMTSAPAYTVPTYTIPSYTLPNYGAQSTGTQQPEGNATIASPVCWTTDSQGRVIVVQP